MQRAAMEASMKYETKKTIGIMGWRKQTVSVLCSDRLQKLEFLAREILNAGVYDSMEQKWSIGVF